MCFLLACLSVYGLMSCNNAAKNVVNDETESEVEEFRSPDLSTFFLQGPVKVLEDVDGMKKTFDEQGQLIEAETPEVGRNGQPLVYKITYDKVASGEVIDGNAVKRDGLGRILWVGYTNSLAFFPEQGYHFEYGEAGVKKYLYNTGDMGRVTMEVTKTDENGLPLQETVTSGDDMIEEVSVKDYEYTAFDDYGNWTERKVKIKTTTTSYEDDSVTKNSSEKVEKRTITYY